MVTKYHNQPNTKRLVVAILFALISCFYIIFLWLLHLTLNVSQKVPQLNSFLNSSVSVPSSPGFGACLLVLDDTIRLYEWISYHYTVLPLTSLVIGLDPVSSNDSIAEMKKIVRLWSHFDLDIVIWPADPTPQSHNFTYSSGYQRGDHQKRQAELFVSCTHYFLSRKAEKWLLLTDTDEFLAPNAILPRENISHFDANTIFAGPRAPSKEKRLRDRHLALPIRKLGQDFLRRNGTILAFIEEQRRKNDTYFPHESGCTRIVGLTYSTEVANECEEEILVTKKYQRHSKYPNDHFSKVMLELPKVLENRYRTNYLLGLYETAHNPFPRLCGKNGLRSSGQDFMGSVLKVSHYIGSLESWLERGWGKGSRVNSQDKNAWEKKNLIAAPFTHELDARMGSWVFSFLSRVGKTNAKLLLFQPLQQRIDTVRHALVNTGMLK